MLGANSGFPFLEDRHEEVERYQTDYERFPRLTAARPDAGIGSREPSPPGRLDQWVVRRFKKSIPVTLLGVTVREDDGMSWTAQAVYDAVGMQSPEIERIALRGTASTDRPPDILQIVPFRRLARLARDRKLSDLRVLDLRTGAALAVVVSVLAIVGGLLKTQLKGPLPFAVLAMAGVALVGLVSEWFRSAVRLRSGDSEKQQIARAIREARNNSAGLVEDIAADLSHSRPTPDWLTLLSRGPFRRVARWIASESGWRHFPRCVVVDGFEKLDPFTQDVVKYYLMRLRARDELWVVFDSATTDELRLWSFDQGKDFPRDGTRWQSQRLLTDEQIAQLAEEKHPDEPWEAATVGSVRRRQDIDIPVVENLLKQLKDERDEPLNSDGGRSDGGGRYSTLRLFYLLGIAAGWGGNPMLPRPFLEEQLSNIEDSAPPQGSIARVLRSLLPGTELQPNEFSERLGKILNTASGRLLIVEGQGRATQLRVMPEVGRGLTKVWRDYGLSPPSLGHMYWALLWHRWLLKGPRQAFWIHKLASHLMRCKYRDIQALSVSDGSEADRGAEPLQRDLFAATTFAIEGALNACLFEDAFGLLDHALDLFLTGAHDSGIAFGIPLLGLAWRASAITGSDSFSRVVDQLTSRRDVQKQEPAEQDPLHQLFSPPLVPLSARSPGLIEELAAPAEADGGIPGDYGWALAAWLAESMAPLSAKAKLASLHDAITYERAEIPDRITDILDRLKRQAPRDRNPLALMVLSESLWTITLARLPRPMRYSTEYKILASMRRRTSTSMQTRIAEDANNRMLLSHYIDRAFEGLPADDSSEDAELADVFKEILSAMAPEVRAMLGSVSTKDLARAFRLMPEEQLQSLRMLLGEGVDALRPLVSSTAATNKLSNVQEGGGSLSARTIQTKASVDYHTLLANSTVIVRDVRELRRTLADTFDFVLDTAARELAVTISACAELISATFLAEPQRSELAAHVVTGIELAGLADDVEGSLALLPGAWSLLGVPRRTWLAEVRGRQFASLHGRPITRSEWQLTGTYFADLLTGLLLVETESAEEYAARELINTVKRVLDAPLTPPLKTELCMLAIACAHSFNKLDLGFALAHMLETDVDGRSYIVHQLNGVPDAELKNHAIRYLNASDWQKQPELAAAVAHVVAERAAQIQDSDLKSAVQYELDVFSLKDRLNADLSIDIDETLKQWKNKHHEVGLYVLYLLLPRKQGPIPSALLNEVCVALQRHRKDVSRDVMLLASRYLIEISDAGAPTIGDKFDVGRKLALQILEDNIEIMDSRLPVDVTVAVYAILLLQTSQDRYKAKFDHWSKIRDAHQAIELSEGLVAAGRFFEDFRNVALAFQALHLPLDKPVPGAQTPDQRKKRIEFRRTSPDSPPRPIITVNGHELISSEFLLDGEALFSHIADEEPSVDEMRDQWNGLARGALPKLRMMITSLPGIPTEMRTMLQNYQERLRRYSPPSAE